AQDGADIVGVGDLIEDKEGGAVGRSQIVAHLIYVDRRQGLGQQGQALMHGARRQQAGGRAAVERARSRRRGGAGPGPRERGGGGGGGGGEGGGGGGGGVGGVGERVRAAAGIAERGLDRMHAEQPVGGTDRRIDGRGRRRAPELLAFAHTGPYDRRKYEGISY